MADLERHDHWTELAVDVRPGTLYRMSSGTDEDGRKKLSKPLELVGVAVCPFTLVESAVLKHLESGRMIAVSLNRLATHFVVAEAVKENAVPREYHKPFDEFPTPTESRLELVQEGCTAAVRWGLPDGTNCPTCGHPAAGLFRLTSRAGATFDGCVACVVAAVERGAAK